MKKYNCFECTAGGGCCENPEFEIKPKINLKEILEKHVDLEWSVSRNAEEKILEAMRDACEQAIVKAAYDAKLTDFAQEFMQEEANGAINKHSILDVKKDIV